MFSVREGGFDRKLVCGEGECEFGGFRRDQALRRFFFVHGGLKIASSLVKLGVGLGNLRCAIGGRRWNRNYFQRRDGVTTVDEDESPVFKTAQGVRSFRWGRFQRRVFRGTDL